MVDAVCVSANSQGFLAITSTPVESCTTFVLQSAELFQGTEITVSEMGQFLGAGIALMLFSYFLTWPIGIVKQAIRKV